MVPDENPSVAELIIRHYDELRRLAHAQLRRERAGQTLQTTELVSEAYLRLARLAGVEPEERTRFFAVVSTTIRRVLVDRARARHRLKRGGGLQPLTIDPSLPALSEDEADELVALDEALTRLEQIDPRGSAVVQHRFFGGLTLEETAAVLGVSTRTVQRDWLAARAWLRKEVAAQSTVEQLEGWP